MPSPETDIATAYGLGRTASANGQPITANPYVLDGSSLIQAQWTAWNQGYGELAKDLINGRAFLIAGGAGGNILPGFALAQKKTVVSNAQVLTLFTAEVELVPAIPGYTIKPVSVHSAKAAGAYTVASVTALQVAHGVIADNLPFMAAGSVTNLLTAAGAYISSGGVPGDGITASVGVFDLTPRTGKKLSLRTTGASPAGAGGALTVTVFYRLVADSY